MASAPAEQMAIDLPAQPLGSALKVRISVTLPSSDAASESRAAAGNAVDAFSSAAVADAMRPSTAALERVDQLQRAVDAVSDDVATLKRLDGGAVLRTWTEARLAELGSSGGPLSPGSRSDVASLKEDVAAASAMTRSMAPAPLSAPSSATYRTRSPT